MRTLDEWKTTLRAAQVARRPLVVSLYRELLGALDNAEAADVSAAPAAQAGHIAGGVAGLGTGEVARRALTPTQAREVLERERAERREARSMLVMHGRHEEAARLEQQLSWVDELLGLEGTE